MINIEELKNNLKVLIENKWDASMVDDIFGLALDSLSNIGNKDAELRDELILSFLFNIIMEKKISKIEIKTLLEKCLREDYLFYEIGEVEGDSVYRRSFTILIIRTILLYHNKFGEDLLDQREIEEVYSSVVRYLRMEKDVRGYTKGGGWAHSLSHGALAMRALSINKHLGERELTEFLWIIKEKVGIGYHVHGTEECEKLAIVVTNIIKRDVLEDEKLIEWIRAFGQMEQPEVVHEMVKFRQNIQTFLRALFFRIRFKDMSSELQEEIEITCHKLNDFYNSMDE